MSLEWATPMGIVLLVVLLGFRLIGRLVSVLERIAGSADAIKTTLAPPIPEETPASADLTARLRTRTRPRGHKTPPPLPPPPKGDDTP